MSVRKQGGFEALCYDARSSVPFLKFRGRLDINSRKYDVDIEQGSDGSVSVNLAQVSGGYFSFISCPKGLVAINDDKGRYLSKQQFLEAAGLSDSDVSGLVRILKKESRILFGSSSSEHMQPCLDKLRLAPFVCEFRAVLHKELEPLLEKLKLSRDDKERVYTAALSSYYQFDRRV